MKELWQEICFVLHDISLSSSEELYEQKIIQSLEKLGWSRFRKEIVLKQSSQLGSAGTIIPDIIVGSQDKNESFVIEVKRPSADIENESHKQQLFSYMRQLKLEHGLLIGNKIQIYYDGKLKKIQDPILLKSIDISETNQDGLLFVNLFQKGSFSYQKLENFAEKTIQKLSAEAYKKKLRNLLFSPDYQRKLQQLIIDDLQQNWDKETIQTVFSQLSVSIRTKDSVPSTPNPSDPVIQKGIKIGELVRSSMNMVIAYCVRSEKEISNLRSSDYSKDTFDVNFPFLKQVSSESPKQDRYWKLKYVINGKYYVVTSEWYKPSLPLFKDYLAKITQQK